MATLATIVLIFGIHSFVDWTWFVPGTAVVALLAAGWVAGRGPLDQAPGQPRWLGAGLRAGLRSPVRLAAAAMVLAIGLLAAWTTWMPLRSVHADTDAIELAAKDYPKARALAETAHDRNPLSIDPLLSLAVVETVAGHKDRARRALVDAVRLQPANASAWEYLARFALDQQNDPKLALRLLGPALYLDPKSPTGVKDYLDALRAATEQAQEQARHKAQAKAKRQADKRRRKKATR
jgi:tetratricopeptide (TPR) repeat protein